MQFRTLDFGMETCSIVIALPGQDHSEPGSKVVDTYRFAHESKIDVWKVNAPRRLNPEKLSWSTRPALDGLFASMSVNVSRLATTWESPEFHCRSGTLHTFEFACAEGASPCHIQFVEDYKRHDGNLGKHFGPRYMVLLLMQLRSVLFAPESFVLGTIFIGESICILSTYHEQANQVCFV